MKTFNLTIYNLNTKSTRTTKTQAMDKKEACTNIKSELRGWDMVVGVEEEK